MSTRLPLTSTLLPLTSTLLPLTSTLLPLTSTLSQVELVRRELAAAVECARRDPAARVRRPPQTVTIILLHFTGPPVPRRKP
eukprot:662724-Pyramimonas_sp.AAC.1